MVDSPEGTCLTTGASKGEVEIGVFAYRLLIGRVGGVGSLPSSKVLLQRGHPRISAPPIGFVNNEVSLLGELRPAVDELVAKLLQLKTPILLFAAPEWPL